MNLVKLLIVLIWVGLLWSRAILSIGMIGLILLALILNAKEGWKTIRKSTWLQGMALLFIIPLLTAFWSTDISQWSRVVQVKMPLLLLPFTIPLLVNIDKPGRYILLYILYVLVFVSSLYSFWNYFSSPGITDAYLRAKVLPVAMSNDHVRYAWLLVIVYALTLYDLLAGDISQKTKAVLGFFLAYLAVFIHVLAAKTGLLGFYLVSAIAIIRIVPTKKRLIYSGILLIIPLLSWFIFPSFQNRIKFVLWDFQNYSRGDYVEGLSDAPRVLSYQAGWDIIQKNPLTGVGAGDVLKETWTWYNNHTPFLKQYERLLPSNEAMIYAAGAGILAGLICLAVFLLPFFMKKLRGNMLWLSLHAVAFIGFMYEIGLEVQHGVFLFCFFSCLIYAWLSPAAATEEV